MYNVRVAILPYVIPGAALCQHVKNLYTVMSKKG